MNVCILSAELHLPAAGSLKAKRSIVQSIVRTVDNWKGVGAAEVGSLDLWQRASLGFTAIAPDFGHAEELADAIERFVWSRPDVDVLSIERDWWEAP